MSGIRIFLYIVFMIICVALTFIVLAQEGKSAGLGAISGMADSYWGKNKGRSMEGKLQKITIALCVLFMVLGLVLNIKAF
ncbi:MAG: preprotein translocase subunit SecG [Lachnospiraceae bacterium]|nr:preprotein translocase subunit SecG [Lachnospiraceae bacterium]